MPLSPTASKPAPVAAQSLALEVLRERARALSSRVPEALAMLEQSRVYRVMNWGPPKGGKTTSILGGAYMLSAPVRVLSVDHDLTPRDNVQWVLLPAGSKIRTREDLPKLHTALMAALKEAAEDIRTGKIAGVIFDTISTMYDVFDRLMVQADPGFGIGKTQMAVMRERGAQARACGGICSMVFSLRDVAQESPLDCPIILAVTEHAREIKSNDEKSWGEHEGWEPRIAGSTGAQIFGQVDLQLGFSTDAEPGKTRSYKVRTTGNGYVGLRMTAAELAAFEAHVSQVSKLDRMVSALSEVWNMRKVAWAKQFASDLLAAGSK